MKEIIELKEFTYDREKQLKEFNPIMNKGGI